MGVIDSGGPRQAPPQHESASDAYEVRERAKELHDRMGSLDPEELARQMRGFLQVVALRDMLVAVEDWAKEAQGPVRPAPGRESTQELQRRFDARAARIGALEHAAELLRAIALDISRSPVCDPGTRSFAFRVADRRDTSHILPVAGYLNIEMLLPRELLALYPLLP